MSEYKGRKGCCVYCETNGKTYKSISEAAEAVGVSNWSMGVKMEVAGKFIDKYGNIYKRGEPMHYRVKGKVYSGFANSPQMLKPHAKKRSDLGSKHRSNIQHGTPIIKETETINKGVLVAMGKIAFDTGNYPAAAKIAETLVALKV
jgi:hypothetical protein